MTTRHAAATSSNRPFAQVRRASLLCLLAGVAATCTMAWAGDENPAPTLQWFECPWSVMERRMGDVFVAGYGSVWLPPPSRAYVWPGSANQASSSVGYDVHDRFNLGTPTAPTAYGTEAYFHAMVQEYKRAGVEVYIDAVLNHNGFRQTGAGFMADGGFPGFWMNPPTPLRDKTPTDDWGDFNKGIASGYYQSESPGSARYCLLSGDLVALTDINQASNHQFIRQPVTAGDPRNLPAGTHFNKPDASNARFYPDVALGVDTVSNPGMSYVGGLSGGAYAPPCDVPWRNEPASSLTFGRFNLAQPGAGDPVPESATGYTLRWVQWMMDVQGVDGFRLDAVKHVPSWYWDTYFDTVTSMRRVTPDGRRVNPVVLGECVDGNDFCFDRYVRKPNGRTAGRSAAGDAFANRDVLDIVGAARLRSIVGAGGTATLSSLANDHIDLTDDGLQNGTVGFNHIWSHDNGSAGDGGSSPPIPTARQQGWYMHAYLLFRPGPAIVYHHGRGVNRTGSGFYPRQGVPVALGQDGSSTNLEPAIVNLVQLSNHVGRGEFQQRWQDGDTYVFERRTRVGASYSGNCLVALNDRYDGGFDTRTVTTSFPQGTRLMELTGNATNATVDPSGDILDVVTVGAGGSVTIRVPRNANASGVEHHKGFVVYAPAIPSGTLSIVGASSTIAADAPTTPAFRRRLNAVPVVTGDSFEIRLATVRGDAGAPNNNEADDNAVFRLNAGFEDWNGNGVVDIDFTNAVVPGYEQFVTQRSPLAGTTATQGLYRQSIDASRLDEGLNYVSVVAFRKRNAGDAPLFREFRTPMYVDRLAPESAIIDATSLAEGTTSATLQVRALDRTVNRVHVIANPPTVADPTTLATGLNQAARRDRLDYVGAVSGLVNGVNRILVVSFEETGRAGAAWFDLRVGPPPCLADFNQDGGIDGGDIGAFFDAWEAADPAADVNEDGGIDGGDVAAFFALWEQGGC
jgi:hypothetical protein